VDLGTNQTTPSLKSESLKPTQTIHGTDIFTYNSPYKIRQMWVDIPYMDDMGHFRLCDCDRCFEEIWDFGHDADGKK